MGKCIIRIYDEDTGELLQKSCSKCGKVKDVSEFSKHPRTSDGLQSNCRECGKISCKKYREDNGDYFKNWREGNKNRIKKYGKIYRKKNNRWEYIKKWRENNKEHYKEYQKEYKQTPEGRASMHRRKHKYMAKKLGNGGSYTKEQWNQCLEYFNHCDAYTGEPLESTEIEHVIPVSKGGTSNIYNLVPANKSINRSKQDKDLWEWYSKQPYFSWDRYLKICFWIIKKGGAIE